MAKSQERIKARELRVQGISIIVIAHDLKVSKSTVSDWCRDIILNAEQTERLRLSKSHGGSIGRLKGALVQKQRRLAQIDQLQQVGIRELSSLSRQNLLLAGLGLFWGEGQKDDRRFGFSNSDPNIIKFMIKWLRIIFNIELDDLFFAVLVNKIYEKEVDQILDFWYKLTGATPSQFRKTTFIQAKNKKIYSERGAYCGVLQIRVRNSSYLQRRILGLLTGLSHAKIDPDKAV